MATTTAEEIKEKHEAVDLWRDSPLRYLGYANELGESFRPIFPRAVLPSYVVAFGYVLGDATDKAQKATTSPWIQAADALIWQSFASVIIPGFTINRLVHLAQSAWKGPGSRWGPTGIGLAAIPVIIHPIDQAVDFAMNSTIRQHYPKVETE
mmetsp:Transcript_16514/g.33840  ORF Transcript_16514/g.33840 Transcript_16514/m.33840 type:complete len:152 (-) Transcript_16514:103-558(-)|eukprot:CAMPEP_0183308764 /NCGR_PEP_ID=MMETSP0160_2-20130417/22447_1 /TAXON_ID=2839 ORGANISM="Odontella Sinensis, Strain Grunow 1884" /NCGR_SAMPLE_ID=MMETSP0160_2 /ASSEMBLY_ACC=CAM_ASM_000250 /LENGTH=151 /DNA_ID=CAMNT_0025472653 /DNA_START=211 /DNA_END=666 /DNA_ORIENTATION=+